MSGTIEVPIEDQNRALRKIEQIMRSALSEIRDDARKRAEFAEQSYGRSPGYRRIEEIAEDALRHRQGVRRKLAGGYERERGGGLENWGVEP